MHFIQSRFLLFPFLLLMACAGEETIDEVIPLPDEQILQELPPPIDNPIHNYMDAHPENGEASISSGSVSNGALENGKLLPWEGPNFRYFDTASYLGGRAFTNDRVRETMLDAYALCEETCPNHLFRMMEASKEHGGELWPHRTHRNGLSIDFMVPVKKDGKPSTDLDDLGAGHYFITFDDDGAFADDTSYTIDFEIMARHILALNEAAEQNGLAIKKVLLKIALKDDLFETDSGLKLKDSGIYFAQSLEPVVDDLHDDHYHVDFELK